MMLLGFILVLTMSVAAQSADHVPHDSNYYCGDNIAEFGKAFVEYCSSLREKRKVLEEYVLPAGERNPKEAASPPVTPDLPQQLKTQRQQQQLGSSVLPQQPPSKPQQLLRSATWKKPNKMALTAINLCCAHIEWCLRMDAIRWVYSLVCKRPGIP